MSQSSNRLTRIFSEEELSDVKNSIKAALTKVTPFTTNVGEEEIPSLIKVGDGDKVLIADCLVESKEADEFLPPYFKMATVKTSDTLHDQLFELEDVLFDAYLLVRRNRMLAGSEALAGVSTFYAYIKTAAISKNKVATAVAMFKRLQEYYQKRADVAKAKKRQREADKAALEANKAAIEAERTAEKAALEAEKAALQAENTALKATKGK